MLYMYIMLYFIFILLYKYLNFIILLMIEKKSFLIN